MIFFNYYMAHFIGPGHTKDFPALKIDIPEFDPNKTNFLDEIMDVEDSTDEDFEEESFETTHLRR